MTVRAIVILLAALVLGACYGATRPPGDDSDADSSSPGDSGPWPDSSVWWPDGDLPEVGPVCPDGGGPRVEWECDVLNQTGCLPGEGCYGWTEYTNDPCVREIYRSGCMPGGLGRQGDPCDAWCRPGLECFVTGQGTQCLYICDIHGGEPRCPPGLICRPTDLPALGACH